MPDIDHIRGEIEHMRTQIGRQRREILQLQRAGILADDFSSHLTPYARFGHSPDLDCFGADVR